MSQLTPPVTERDHAEGPANARVTLVEYGDFECPMCGEAHVVIKEAQRAFGPNLRFVFRHFPLRSSHPHALEAAKAAEAAGAQGRFWPMHERLFQHQTRLDSESLVAHARTLGLDLDRFRRDLQAQGTEDRIREDLSSGAHSGVQRHARPVHQRRALRRAARPAVADRRAGACGGRQGQGVK